MDIGTHVHNPFEIGMNYLRALEVEAEAGADVESEAEAEAEVEVGFCPLRLRRDPGVASLVPAEGVAA